MTPYDAPMMQAANEAVEAKAPLVDGHGRRVTYLRVSVTDRCDFRCVYCMPERMTFLPKSEVLTIEEIDCVASAFVGLGVRKLRLTGGEPLARKGVLSLVERLARHLKTGALEELTLTTNGSRLAQYASELSRLGVRRINVSMDTLRPDVFGRLTRGGDLMRVLAGIEAATAAGLTVKINTVALARDNAREIPALVQWAHAHGHEITLIETMPMGEIDEDRTDQFISLARVREELESFWTLRDLSLTSGGPARYVEVAETGGRLGFITPMSHNFCERCNRVRLTCTGVLHSCLGQEDACDLRAVVRGGASTPDLADIIRSAIHRKPKGHDFRIDRGARASVSRHMSTTGG
jgi:cyclic pyranopterin phosphate synthase